MELISREEAIVAVKEMRGQRDDDGYLLVYRTEVIDRLLSLLKVKENTETKFYYVESIDDYWIGEDLGDDCTLYYAKWDSKLGFVFGVSRYLPWGEYVVSPTSLWKEYTYPSEPKEIPFTDWIIGFLNKYFKGE